MTDHDEIQMEIPDYVRGRLDGESSRGVEAHLAECGDCAELRDGLHLFASAISREGDALFEPHPGLQELEAFALARGAGAREDLSRHVATCAPCGLQVEVGRREHGRAVASSVRSNLTSLALIAAGILIGSALVMTFRSGGSAVPGPAAPGPAAPGPAAPTIVPSAPATLPALSVPMISVRSLRGGARQEIEIAPGEPALYLVVSLAVPPDVDGDSPIAFEVRRSGGATVWISGRNPASTIRSQLDSTGVVGHLLPGEALQAGEHELRVYAGEGPERAEISRIEFTVRHAAPRETP